jgi:hypothetical protein
MNERIKELSLQASDSIPDDVSAEHAMYLFQEKFAELIVKECIDLAMGEMVSADEMMVEETDERAYLLGNNGGILDAVGAIRLHFGV